MPDTLPGWLMFGFYTLGSLGGLGFIGLFLFEVVGSWVVWKRSGKR